MGVTPGLDACFAPEVHYVLTEGLKIFLAKMNLMTHTNSILQGFVIEVVGT